MHEGVPTWKDDWFCEPEPRRREAADEPEQRTGDDTTASDGLRPGPPTR